MTKLFNITAVFAALFLAMPFVSYAATGTSIISFAPGNATVLVGAGTTTSYSVDLLSGKTWGTTIDVVNQAQLSPYGITTHLTSVGPSDPPFSGTLMVFTTPSTPVGRYSITLEAFGDDPSAANATFTLDVISNSPTTTVSANNSNTASSIASTVQTTLAPQTTVAYPAYGNQYGSSYGSLGLMSGIAILIILVVFGYLTLMTKALPTKLIFIGTGLILIGTVAWLYGDYAGMLFGYIWAGVVAILLGIILWVYGDMVGGTFKHPKAKTYVIAGVILILLGTAIWLYGDLYSGAQIYIWGGAALIIIGTAIWLYGDKVVGAFVHPGKEKAK